MKEKRIKNMKKLATFALAALLGCTLALVGCSSGEKGMPLEENGIPLDKVLIMGNSAAVSPVYRYYYDIITGASKDAEPDKAGTTRKCILGGREYELFYRCTYTFSLGDYCCYEYAVDPERIAVYDPYMDQSPIGFYQSGALAFIDNYYFEPALELEIEGAATVESIRAAVEKLLESAVDLDVFERFESGYREWKYPDDEGAPGYYEMRWFNEKDGKKLPGAVTARVSTKGRLKRVDATDAESEPLILPEDFDFEPYLDAIERKARTFCRNNDRNTELEITGYMATTIGGSPYVWARVSVRFDSFSFPDDNYRNSAEFVVPIE